MIEQIVWLGHGSFRITGAPVIYIDPWRVTRDAGCADVILISHEHSDHCSPADVEKLRTAATRVIASQNAAPLLGEVTVLRPWQVVNVGRVSVRGVPAYNEHHPREKEGLGFVLSIGFYDIYYAGDTGLIPEMDGLRPDIAILPIGGNETMRVQDAVEAVRRLRPRWVIPSHWGNSSGGGSIVDARAFVREIGDLTEAVLPEQAR